MAQDNQKEQLEDLKEEITEMKNYPLKLSWKQIWVCASVFLTIVGSSFGVGLKVQREFDKVEILKKERQFQQQMAVVEEREIELKRQLKELDQDIVFFKNRYIVVSERLKQAEKEIIDLENKL